MNCRRCDFDAADLIDHAFESGHLLCVVCRRQSLSEFEPQTCPACIGRVRADLADIAQGYALLEPAGLVAMTLLGDGTMQRHAHRYELDSLHPAPHPLDDTGEAVAKPIRDEWPADPLPIVAALASWEDFWRADFGDPVGGQATLSDVIGYLTRNLDSGHRAAQRHPAFDEFAQELGRLRSMVQHGAGLADVPLEADAKCFDCGGPLRRTYRPSSNDGHRRLGLPWEGLTDDWTCAWCRWVYGQQGYFLGLREAASVWVPVSVAAKSAQKSAWTVRSWQRRGLVTSACRVEDRAVLVWWPDVSDRAFRHADDAQSQRTA